MLSNAAILSQNDFKNIKVENILRKRLIPWMNFKNLKSNRLNTMKNKNNHRDSKRLPAFM